MWSWITRFRRARQRILDEDALKHLHACEWQGGLATTESLAGALRLSISATIRLCQHLQKQGSMQPVLGGYRLTPEGEQLAVQVIRAHRLWERYLADEARVPMERLHGIADHREHRRPPGHIQQLDAAMGHPSVDPHGDPIPSADGSMTRTRSASLVVWPVGQPATIVHLEDEPAAVFSQIVAQGLAVGQRVRVVESDRRRIVFVDGHDTHVLSPVIAANVYVTGAGHEEATDDLRPLASLLPSEHGVVRRLDGSLQGLTRRRLLDLGLTPGADVRAEFHSMGGDPVAYLVRGTLIALRREQAAHIWINSHHSRREREHESSAQTAETSPDRQLTSRSSGVASEN